MIKGLYTSAAGMLPLSHRQDLASNNLANTSNSGYKQDRAFVRALINADMYLSEGGFATNGQPPQLVNVDPPAYIAAVGQAASQVIDQRTDFSQGPLEVTGNDFNLAIQGNGFFTVQTTQGIQYTRSSSFGINNNGNLVTSDGFVVLGTGGPINVQGGKLTVQQNGAVLVDGIQRGTLRITDFPQPYKLSKTQDNLFVSQAGAGQQVQNPVVRQGVVEGANGNPIDQMVQMIEISRMFELGQRAIRLQDETLQQAVSQVGRI
ncbi:MAG TPA: flagellar hook-basal body protein [Candidatus Glassbacteria bacterium]|nr:flagellar hook-basal body protein [Candidatus Glassbacteria bacterium]